MIYKSFQCQIYNVTVLYVADCNIIELQKVLQKRLGITLDETALDGTYNGLTLSLPEISLFIVWICNRKRLEVLCHECVHLVDKIFESRGLGHAEPEATAYYVSYWFDKFWKIKK